MAKFAVNNGLAGTLQAITSTYKSLLEVTAQTTSLKRGKLYDFTFGTIGTAADQTYEWDISRYGIYCRNGKSHGRADCHRDQLAVLSRHEPARELPLGLPAGWRDGLASNKPQRAWPPHPLGVWRHGDLDCCVLV